MDRLFQRRPIRTLRQVLVCSRRATYEDLMTSTSLIVACGLDKESTPAPLGNCKLLFFDSFVTGALLGIIWTEEDRTTSLSLLCLVVFFFVE